MEPQGMLEWLFGEAEQQAQAPGQDRAVRQRFPSPETADTAAQRGETKAACGGVVTLHIYDLSPSFVYPNTVGRALGTGAFHVGVEIYGNEWTFTGSDGVIRTKPKREWGTHVYRESLEMGRTKLSESEVKNLCLRMRKRWRAPNYELYTRNCCHFSNELCINLSVGPIPTWLTSLAGGLATLSETAQELPSMGGFFYSAFPGGQTASSGQSPAKAKIKLPDTSRFGGA